MGALGVCAGSLVLIFLGQLVACAPVENFCEGKEVGFYADANDPASFYHCLGNSTIYSTCQNNLIFDMASHWCIKPITSPPPPAMTEAQTTTVTTATTTPNTTTPVTDAPPFCSGKPNGYYADSEDVTRYILCFNGEMNHFRCSVGLVFSTRFVACIVPITTAQPTQTTPKTTTGRPQITTRTTSTLTTRKSTTTTVQILTTSIPSTTWRVPTTTTSTMEVPTTTAEVPTTRKTTTTTKIPTTLETTTKVPTTTAEVRTTKKTTTTTEVPTTLETSTKVPTTATTEVRTTPKTTATTTKIPSTTTTTTTTEVPTTLKTTITMTTKVPTTPEITTTKVPTTATTEVRTTPKTTTEVRTTLKTTMTTTAMEVPTTRKIPTTTTMTTEVPTTATTKVPTTRKTTTMEIPITTLTEIPSTTTTTSKVLTTTMEVPATAEPVPKVKTTTSTMEDTSASAGPPDVDPNYCLDKENGIFLDPLNRFSFYQCFQGKTFHLQCPQQLVFDPRRGICDWPVKDTFDPTFCRDRPDGNYPHPLNANIFYQCTSGITSQQKCQTVLVFDKEANACVWPYSTSTTAPPRISTLTTGTTSRRPNICCGKEDGLYPDPKDKSAFYQCVAEVTIYMMCHPNLVFNPFLNVCEYPSSG